MTQETANVRLESERRALYGRDWSSNLFVNADCVYRRCDLCNRLRPGGLSHSWNSLPLCDFYSLGVFTLSLNINIMWPLHALWTQRYYAILL